MAKEVSPKNILLIGPTGVGKTEIARRIATLTRAPFVKVEATKYTEVGYVGRDVESMIRDLAEEAVRLVKKEESSPPWQGCRRRSHSPHRGSHVALQESRDTKPHGHHLRRGEERDADG